MSSCQPNQAFEIQQSPMMFFLWCFSSSCSLILFFFGMTFKHTLNYYSETSTWSKICFSFFFCIYWLNVSYQPFLGTLLQCLDGSFLLKACIVILVSMDLMKQPLQTFLTLTGSRHPVIRARTKHLIGTFLSFEYCLKFSTSIVFFCANFLFVNLMWASHFKIISFFCQFNHVVSYYFVSASLEGMSYMFEKNCTIS